MKNVLERVRKLNSIFRYSSENEMPLQEFCVELANIIKSNIYLFYENGHIFCHATTPDFQCPYNDLSLEGHTLPDAFLCLFNKKDRSVFNVHEICPICTYGDVGACALGERYFSLIPIHAMTAKRAGVLLIRYGEPFAQGEEMLSEYAALVVSMDLMYREQANLRENSVRIAYSQLAVRSLSSSELHAASAVLRMVDREHEIVKLTDAATKAYVTQSAVSSALQKLEGAGVISTQTLGVKGKRIHVENEYLLTEIERKLGRI